MIELKIEDHADQQFEAVFENRRVTVRLWYNNTSERWEFDLAIDDLPVLNGRRVVTGVDLLKSFDFGIGVLFAADVVAGSVPDRSSLPAGLVKLFQTTDEEIEATNGDPFIEPVTPTVRPLLWTPPPATYFGFPFGVARLIDQIEEGFAIDFLGNEILIRSNDDPSLNFIGTWQEAVDAGKFEYGRASIAYAYNENGILDDVAVDLLRYQYDPLTGKLAGALIEPASVNLVTTSNTIGGSGAGVTVTNNVMTAPDGTLTADLVQETVNNNSHYVADVTQAGTTIGQKYLWSVFVKKSDNPRPVALRTTTAKGAHVTFDPTGDGAWLDGDDFEARGFDVLPDDWFRVWMVVEVDTGGNLVARVQLLDWSAVIAAYAGDGVSGNYFWGRDLRLLDRPVRHFPTSGVADGPALDDFQIPLASIPWHDGTGEFLVNGKVIVPNVVADKIVFPTSITDPIASVIYRLA